MYREPKRARIRDDSVYHEKINHSNTILNRIKRLHSEQLLTDVVLVINGREYPAHRLILCTASDVFQVMLTKTDWIEKHDNRTILQEQRQCADVFHLFLAYLYSGEIVLTHDNVMPILILADKYNVKKLINTCSSYIYDNASYADAHTLITWFEFTLTCGRNAVSKMCQNFVKWNLALIAESEDFGKIGSNIFISLLQQNDLVVKDEVSLYHYTIKWLDHQSENLKQNNMPEVEIEQYMGKLTEQVVMHIRFPMMTPRELAELLLSPLINKCKGFFLERMGIGMSYHMGQEDKVSQICKEEFGKLLFTPRLYTNDNFSSLLYVDKFSSVSRYDIFAVTFSSHRHLADHKGDSTCDWIVELFPKGVYFDKSILLGWTETLIVPDYVMPTVRLRVTCKDITKKRVKIAVLIYGTKAETEQIIRVIEQIHILNHENTVIIIDDLIPFRELNPICVAYQPKKYFKPCYFVGLNENSLKMHVIITPVTGFCSTYSPDLSVK